MAVITYFIHSGICASPMNKRKGITATKIKLCVMETASEKEGQYIVIKFTHQVKRALDRLYTVCRRRHFCC